VLVLLHISQIPALDQNFATNGLHLFPNYVHKRFVHKRICSNHIVYIMYVVQLTFVFTNAFSSCPFIGPEPALGISAKVSSAVIRWWTNRKHVEYWWSIRGQRQAKGFLKRLSAKRAGELLSLNRNQLKY
jgi:hypothetical protein